MMIFGLFKSSGYSCLVTFWIKLRIYNICDLWDITRMKECSNNA